MVMPLDGIYFYNQIAKKIIKSMFKIFLSCKSRDYGSDNKIINAFSELNKAIILKSGS